MRPRSVLFLGVGFKSITMDDEQIPVPNRAWIVEGPSLVAGLEVRF